MFYVRVPIGHGSVTPRVESVETVGLALKETTANGASLTWTTQPIAHSVTLVFMDLECVISMVVKVRSDSRS